MLFKLIFLSFAVYQVSGLAGGRNSVVGEFPSLVGVFHSLNNQICGGVIINNRHVLTVANCMLNAQNLLIAATQLSIMSGTNTINFGLPRTPVQAIYVHPQYNPFTFANDIAVVRTINDFNFPVVANPLTLPSVMTEQICELKLFQLKEKVFYNVFLNNRS
jgi:secreted trypsin-like serine protease